MNPSHIVIAGAGHAGFELAASLRQRGFDGNVTLVYAEPGLPYQRPPLSKAYLSGKSPLDALQMRPESFYQRNAIAVMPETKVSRIVRAARRVELASGETLDYDHLVLALGARNRTLTIPGADAQGVHYLRTRTDASALNAALKEARSAVVIGAGFIGLEFSAVACAQGLEVTVLEAAERPMGRALSPEMAEFFADAHRQAGVKLHFGASVTRIVDDGGRATAVETADGASHAADIVLIGIGVEPRTELAEEAGLECDGGIIVDDCLLTNDPHISAIGDCARHPNAFADNRLMRLESVQNAVDQARCVAARLRGETSAYRRVPWFWSEQCGLKLQIAGITAGHDRVVLRGKPSDAGFSAFCYKGERLLGVETVNQPRDHMAARKILDGQLPLSAGQAADEGFDLKGFVS